MTRHILILGVPSLLASQGPGHLMPYVMVCVEHYWYSTGLGCPKCGNHKRALPLWWNDAPVYPAIDAIVRAAEAADTRWEPREVGLDWGTLMSDRRTLGLCASKELCAKYAVEYRGTYWDRLRRAATDYAGVLALANESAPLLKGRVETR